MEIYEASNGKGKCIIILEKKEAKAFVKMAEAAYKANKRMKSFKKILDKFEKELACF